MDKPVFLFPGQGAQNVGMGKDFYDSFPIAREVFQEGDALLEKNLSKIIFEGPIELLTETRICQAALFVTSVAILEVIKQQFPHFRPSVCAGLSLGEYTALIASGHIPFQIGMPLVQFRSEAMQEACESVKGSMAAIFGLSSEEVERLVSELNLPEDLWVANYNCPHQTVISGTIKGIEQGMMLAKAKGAKRVIPLRVHGAFHSGLMRLAEEKLAPELDRIALNTSTIDVVMNVPGNYVKDLNQMRQFLKQQVTHSIRWEQGIRAIEGSTLFVEIGPGKTLTGLNKQIGITAPSLNISQVTDLDSLATILG